MTAELVEIVATLDMLETLNLSECRLTDETAEPIRNMTNVKSLNLAGNPLSGGFGENDLYPDKPTKPHKENHK